MANAGSSASPSGATEARPAGQSRWVCYCELSRPGLTGLVVATTAVGFVLGANGVVEGWRLLSTIVGTALVTGGASALNQWWEIRPDERMDRTRNRPLPRKRISAAHGFLFGLAVSVFGVAILAYHVNWLSAALAAFSLVVYVLVYTPLKRRTTLCTLVGAVAGAIPPLIGWAAAAGSCEAGAWVLFAILFVWQIPHFLSIAWIYRDDYARGGFRMLPVVDPTGETAFGMVIVYGLALLPVSLGAFLVGLAGWVYLVGTVLLGTGFLALGVRLRRERTNAAARRLFLAGIIYLPLLMLLLVFDPTSCDSIADNAERARWSTIAFTGSGPPPLHGTGPATTCSSEGARIRRLGAPCPANACQFTR